MRAYSKWTEETNMKQQRMTYKELEQKVIANRATIRTTKDLDLKRKRPVERKVRLHTAEMRAPLTFVVVRAATIDVFVPDFRFKRIGGYPLVARIFRHDVVVPVKQNGRSARHSRRLAVNERIAFRLDLARRHSELGLQKLDDPIGGFDHVRFVFFLRANTGNTQNFEPLF